MRYSQVLAQDKGYVRGWSADFDLGGSCTGWGAGNDTITGDSDNDTINGDSGNDNLTGEDGNDAAATLGIYAG